VFRFNPASAPDYDPSLSIPRVDDDLTNAMPAVGILHAYMAWVVPTTHAPPLYHLGAILPGFAYEVARRGIRIRGPDGSDGDLPRVWTCLVGGSASGKSTAHNSAQDFVRDWQKTILGQGYIDPYLHLDGSMPGILAASTGYYREGVGATVAVYETDEMTKILSQLDSVAETLIKIFDGRTITRQLRQFQVAKAAGEKVNDTVKSPAISASFATVPASLERVTQSYHLEGGLFGRILWFKGALKPEELQPRRTARTAARTAALAEWQGWTGWLDGLTALGTPLVVQVPGAVYQLLDDELFGKWRELLVNDRDRVNSARMRAMPYAETIAGLYALSRGQLVVDDDDAVRAINLVEACVGALMGIDATVAVDAGKKLRERVLTVLKASGGACSKTVLYNQTGASKMELDMALGTLVDSGVIERIATQNKGPGRKAEFYRVV